MFKGSLLLIIVVAFAVSVSGAQAAAPGGLDGSWGSGGAVFTNFGGTDDTAYGVAVQANGNIVAAGTQEGTTENFALARYQSKNGALDGTCAGKGKTTASFNSTSDETARGVIVRPAGEGGQIDVAGWTDASGVDDDFAVMQFNSSCKLDTQWNKSGMTKSDFGGNDHGRALAERSDGKLLVVGVTDVNDIGDTALALYTKSGKLDTTWQTGGMITYDQSDGGGYDDAVAVLIQPDKEYVTVGTTFGGATTDADCVVSRFNQNGTPDLSFGNGTNGQEFVDFSGSGSDGNDACFAEAFYGGDIIITGNDTSGNTLLARLSGVDGSVVWTQVWNQSNGFEQNNGVQVHNGLIVTAGATDASGNPDDFLIQRFDGDGNPDLAFGFGAGYVTTDLGGDDGARALVIKNSKAIAAGNSDTKGTQDFAVLRYNL
jgi:uncharacterized delta-60 repeat protein